MFFHANFGPSSLAKYGYFHILKNKNSHFFLEKTQQFLNLFSASNLVQFMRKGSFRWVKKETPEESIRKSVWLYFEKQ